MNIRPCPFCGDDDPIHDEVSPEVFAVICDVCGCIGPTYHGMAGGVSAELEVLLANTTLEQAIAAWNSRSSADLRTLMDEPLKRFCEKHGWDFEMAKLGHLVPEKMDAELSAVMNMDNRDEKIRSLTGIIVAILEADERGQGLPFAEAMDAARKAAVENAEWVSGVKEWMEKKQQGAAAIAYTPKRFFEAGTAVLRARTNKESKD